MMKKVFLAVLLCVSMIPAALSQTRIMMVTENGELEVEGAGFLSDWLRGQGFIVDVDQGAPGQSEFAGELTQEEITRLNSYDVVLVNRSVSSGNFNSDIIFLQ